MAVMNKRNRFRSSNFHMDTGDILHMIIKDEAGVFPEYMLLETSPPLEPIIEVPPAPVPGDPTDITEDTVPDIDGNLYTYVTIGTQQWMVENFRSTKYADGSPIPYLNGVTGAELLTGWTNVAFDTFTSSGKNITLAINPDTGNGQCNANVIAAPPLNLRLSVDLTINSGDVPHIRYYYDFGGSTFYDDVTYPTPLVEGLNEFDINVPAGRTNIQFYFQNILIDPTPPYVYVNCDFSAVCSVKELLLWENDTTGAYCYYDDDVSNVADYGLLYNWYAVDNASGLAPAGWRVPSDGDWRVLQTYLGGETVAGGKLKEAGLTHWSTPNTGAVNTYGFTALPGGARGGSFVSVNEDCHFQSSSLDDDSVIVWLLYHSNASFYSSTFEKYAGYSVRMMRDAP